MNIPLKVFSHYSVQSAYCHIDDLVKKAADLKLPAVALTDINSISGSVEFLKEIEKINKNSEDKILGIIGSTFNVFYGDFSFYITILAKNKAGYLTICKLLSKFRYREDGSYGIDSKFLEELQTKDIRLIIGGINSPVHRLEEYQSYLMKLHHLDVYFSYEFTGHREDKFINDRISNLLMHSNEKTVNLTPVYYLEKEDQLYQQIIVCSKYKTDIEEIRTISNNTDLSDDVQIFFENDKCYLNKDTSNAPDYFLKDFEFYSLSGKPKIPDLPGISDPHKRLIELCRQGWKDREINKKIDANPQLKNVYTNRIKEELEAFDTTGLSSYLLIVHNFVNFARQNNAFMTPRGSAVGCLVCYLIGVSSIDPVLPDPSLDYDPARELLFSRFINKGRFNEGEISFPECDLESHKSV